LLLTVACLLALWPAFATAQTEDEFEDLSEPAATESVDGDADFGEIEADADEADEPPAAVRRQPTRSQTRSDADTLSPNYALRLQELEDQVNDLKEQIFRSKSRLVLLRERVMGTRIGGSQAIITHVNDMSATFTVQSVVYSLDGSQLYTANDDDSDLDDRDEIELYNGAILPGPHNLAVEMQFVGNGFGLFSYLEGYRVRVRRSYAFTAEDGKIANLRVLAFEQGGINQPMEERPDVEFELEFVDNVVTEE